ncbi:MAG: septum site-determining protein MinC [Chloroflexi bacterium]|nr:septum site-determining protein MinC [Chloroflexota bacterium]
MSQIISIKGIREGLLVTVPDGDWAVVQPALLQRLDESAEFFQGARVVLRAGGRSLSAAQLGELRDQFSERNMHLWVVLSDSPVALNAALSLGLLTELPGPPPPPDPVDRPLDTRLSGEEAVLIRRTLRSGNSLSYPGHVVVIGDVNPGAEIIAGGDVVVWGRLRGTAHAGAAGDENAVVCALELSPTQLRVAGQIAISPAQGGQSQPEIARIRQGKLVAEHWNPRE